MHLHDRRTQIHRFTPDRRTFVCPLCDRSNAIASWVGEFGLVQRSPAYCTALSINGSLLGARPRVTSVRPVLGSFSQDCKRDSCILGAGRGAAGVRSVDSCWTWIDRSAVLRSASSCSRHPRVRTLSAFVAAATRCSLCSSIRSGCEETWQQKRGKKMLGNVQFASFFNRYCFRSRKAQTVSDIR